MIIAIITCVFETTVNAHSEEDRSQHRDRYPALFDKCVGSFKSPDKVSRGWTYGLTSLSEKTRRSNHLQLTLEQRQDFVFLPSTL